MSAKTGNIFVRGFSRLWKEGVLANLIEDNVTGDIFSVEQAAILFNICWFSLKGFIDNDTWKHGPLVVSGLKLAFILCREVPVLLKKVLRLLSVLSLRFPSKKAFSMLSSSSTHLCESQWASFFHQVSLGTDFSLRLFSSAGKQKDQKTTDVNGSCLPSVRRLAPESVRDLEGYVVTFFQGLPHGTIVCIGMFGGDFAGLLTKLFQYKSSTPPAWIMLYRFNLDSVPVVVVLPIDGTLAEASGSSLNKKSSSWRCPWGKTIIDEVAPRFRQILEDNYTSLKSREAEDPKWLMSRRQELDTRLSGFLSDVEASWFGPCKHLLLGEWLDNKHLHSLQKKLMEDLKSKCKVDAPESIIKSVLGVAAQDASQRVQWLSELILNKGCYVGENSGKQDSINSLSVSELISAAIQKIQEEEFSTDRQPVILVADLNIQMLPFENMPVLRNKQEVYRMPSVASISLTYHRCCNYREKVGMGSEVFPMIDPLDASYLLNPKRDLIHGVTEFEKLFKDRSLQGWNGTSPSVNEFRVALKNHDLFIYYGHGSGLQHVRNHEIHELDGCASAIMMGCNSGALHFNGPYTSRGASLCYLEAGSFFVVSNLWEVVDVDITQFGKAMLNTWMTISSTTPADCGLCVGDKRKRKEEADTHCVGCKHRPRIWSSMRPAREACMCQFLTGAAVVIYGVPTSIKGSKNRN